MIRVRADGSIYKQDLNNVIRACYDGIYDLTKDMYGQIEEATTAWVHPVKFTYKRLAHGRVQVSTRHKTFKFVDKGTTKMFVKLSKDWTPKSRVHSLAMGPGSGRVLAKGRKVKYSRGHIEAREFIVPAAQNGIPRFRGYIINRFRERGLT